MQIEPLDATFGATVADIDLRALDAATWEELHDEWLEHALLIFPDQFLDRDAQNEFARRFGNLEFEAAPIANVGRDGRVHADPGDDVVKSLRGTRVGTTTARTCRCKPRVRCSRPRSSSGTPTGWADMRAAYEGARRRRPAN